MSTRPLRILVVEDSPTQRLHLMGTLRAAPGLDVVGHADDVASAVAAAAQLRPDVITMDLEIPGAASDVYGGHEAIRRIMRDTPTPILVLSVHAPTRSHTAAIAALDAGAADVFPKDEAFAAHGAEALCRRVRILGGVTVVARRATGPGAPASGPEAAPPTDAQPIVGLAASTGGPSALRTVIAALRGIPAPVLVVQHIHPEFVASLAGWLQDTTFVPVVVGAEGDELRPGVVYIAPADRHMLLAARRRAHFETEPETLQRPSADELLLSLAAHAGPAAIGAVLTGMGDDGARGLLAVRDAGGHTIAQDAGSSTVDGMPRAARANGSATRVLPLEEIGPAIMARAARAASRP